jgi:peptidyl-dipeptidase Dcp
VLRQRIYEASVARGSRGGAYDNTALVSRIMTLRADKAKLLGFRPTPPIRCRTRPREDPEAVNAMLGKLAPPRWPTRSAKPPTCRR